MTDGQNGESGRKIPKPQMYSALVGSGVAAAILTLNPIKQFFWTREEGVSNTQRIEKLEIAQDEFRKSLLQTQDKAADQMGRLRDEILERQNRNTDKVLEFLRERDGKIEKLEEKLTNRIDRLEDALSGNANTKSRRK